ncbi:SGNH hydrolase-type esterase domain-containing protein [Mycena latifolia]|nr:SGNH hydrolase-type esterase domain-containing protein [Mycena latifolia]
MAHPPSDACLLSIPYLSSRLTLSSRWEYSDNGAIWSAWAGSSIKFYTHNHLSSLFIRIGPKTERKDRWNGGTPMFAVSVTKFASPNPVIETKTFDAEPGIVLQLWEEPIKECYVEITLIDWASILEIDAFICAADGDVDRDSMVANHQILFIGDSIACGLALDPSDGGQPIPRGILDAYPSRAMSILREKYSYPLSLGVAAYPGIPLVGIHHQGHDDSMAPIVSGMVDRFFLASPWDHTPWTPRGRPKFICIALGTNDEATDVAPQLFRSTLERFIRTLSATFPSVKAFYVLPPFRDFNEPDAGAIYADLISNPVVVDDLDVRVCDGLGYGMTAEHTVDGLHPTLAGHNHLAENLAQYLKTQRPPPDPEGTL